MKNDLTKEQLEQPITLTLPLSVLLNITSNDDSIFLGSARAANLAGLPAIGGAHQGGVYAGLSLEDERPVALVLLPGEKEDVTWDKAIAWAKEQGGVLPSRIDQLVLFNNLKSEFKEAAYWSCTPYAGDDASAWCQTFSLGYQSTSRKNGKLRARAVRRIAI